MIFDTNLIIHHVRTRKTLPAQAVIPVVVAGELKALSLKADWGVQKVSFLNVILDYYPLIDISLPLTDLYAEVDAYSQGRLRSHPLPPGMSSRNMGKNDLWIATIALTFDMELHTSDNDFDHLTAFGLRLVKYTPIGERQ
jgi:tRNA(fMet)-specific endonuclease VapC